MVNKIKKKKVTLEELEKFLVSEHAYIRDLRSYPKITKERREGILNGLGIVIDFIDGCYYPHNIKDLDSKPYSLGG